MRTRGRHEIRRARRVAALCLVAVCSAPPAHAAWSQNGVPVCTESHKQRRPAITTDGAHGAIVAWDDDRFGTDDIYAQRVDSSGVVQWSLNGVPVCSASQDQTLPVVAPCRGGGAAIVWQDSRNGGDDIYAQRIDGNGVPLWAFNGIPLTTVSDHQRFPQVIPDGAGVLATPGWIVLWYAYDLNNNEIRVQHVDWSGGALWTSAAAGGVSLASSNGSFASVAMAPDGVGTVIGHQGAVLAWALNGDICARRVSNAGVPQWTINGVPVCALGGDQSGPAIANVGVGTVIVAWHDSRNPDRDIYAQKLDASGTSQWLANGLPVCRAAGSQMNVEIVTDEAGGVIATWEDGRSGVTKIYAQRIDGDGQPMWDLDGIPVCTASGQQVIPRIIPDQAGGAIIAWKDGRSGDDDLYAQRIDHDGGLLWPAAGVPLSTSVGNQISCAIASDGEYGVLAAWEDASGLRGAPDIFANRAQWSGGVVDVLPSQPSGLRLAFVSANPTKGGVRLSLELPWAQVVSAEVIDPLGRRVRTLCSDAELPAGAHTVVWNGEDDAGASAAAGVYFVRVRAGAESLVRRVVRLR